MRGLRAVLLAALTAGGPAVAAAQEGAAPEPPPARGCGDDRLRVAMTIRPFGDWPQMGGTPEAVAPTPRPARAPRVSVRTDASPRPAARAAARGYLGLCLSELHEIEWTEEGRVVRYFAYPLVVSVEPASPAARGGLNAGDTLVAYGGHDLLRDGPVALDRMLVPGDVLRVRLRRDGRTLTRALTVGRAPAPRVAAVGFGPSFGAPNGAPDDWGDMVRVQVEGFAPRTRRSADSATRVFFRDAGGGTTLGPNVAPLPPGAAMRVVLPYPGTPPAAPAPPLMDYLRALPALPATAWVSTAPAALAGAQVVALDDDLREVLAAGGAAGADEGPVRGVFVLKVLPGTPAAEAGLRAGDVVTAAGGRRVDTPAALQRVLAGRALARDARREVTLRVWRAGRARDAALRW